MFLKRSGMLITGSLAVAVALAGCGGSDNSNNNSGGGSSSTAQVRTLNTIVPSAGNTSTLSINANGTSLSGQGGLGYGTLNPAFGYLTVPAGSFTPSGTGTGFSTPVQLTSASGVAANTNYTLVAAGQMGQSGPANPQFFLLPDFSSTTAIPTGQAAVRFVNLSPGSTNYGLYSTVAGLSTPLSTSMSNVT